MSANCNFGHTTTPRSANLEFGQIEDVQHTQLWCLCPAVDRTLVITTHMDEISVFQLNGDQPFYELDHATAALSRVHALLHDKEGKGVLM